MITLKKLVKESKVKNSQKIIDSVVEVQEYYDNLKIFFQKALKNKLFSNFLF